MLKDWKAPTHFTSPYMPTLNLHLYNTLLCAHVPYTNTWYCFLSVKYGYYIQLSEAYSWKCETFPDYLKKTRKNREQQNTHFLLIFVPISLTHKHNKSNVVCDLWKVITVLLGKWWSARTIINLAALAQTPITEPTLEICSSSNNHRDKHSRQTLASTTNPWIALLLPLPTP